VTFSILGRCAQTGRLGMAVSSSSPAVAARCANVRAGVGVASSQNITDPRLGPALLDAIAAGDSAQVAIQRVAAGAPYAEYRQLALVDARGAGAGWSGARTLGIHGTRTGDGWAVAGNMLASEAVLDAVSTTFARSDEPELEARLMAALTAGLQAGGEAGPVHSAGLLVAGAVPWPVTDLRVDWADDGPVQQLAQLWDRWAPQRDDYETRALDPRSAPSYGVPGDPAVDADHAP
jgi:uncharacterized Ntn-hydrolase superfamily protein